MNPTDKTQITPEQLDRLELFLEHIDLFGDRADGQEPHVEWVGRKLRFNDLRALLSAYRSEREKAVAHSARALEFAKALEGTDNELAAERTKREEAETKINKLKAELDRLRRRVWANG